MSTPNYSIFAIPAYLVIAMIPHAYSVALIKMNNNWRWDNASPRSAQNRSSTASSVPKEIHRQFERCRAAHDNMMENMGFVVGGILAGVITKLDATWMNTISAIYLVSRLLYTLSYTQISSQKWSPLRTVWYMVGALAIFATYCKAGLVLVNNGQLL